MSEYGLHWWWNFRERRFTDAPFNALYAFPQNKSCLRLYQALMNKGWKEFEAAHAVMFMVTFKLNNEEEEKR